MTVDIPYASPPQGMKYFTVIGPHIDCMDDQYLVKKFSFYRFIQLVIVVYTWMHEYTSKSTKLLQGKSILLLRHRYHKFKIQ